MYILNTRGRDCGSAYASVLHNYGFSMSTVGRSIQCITDNYFLIPTVHTLKTDGVQPQAEGGLAWLGKERAETPRDQAAAPRPRQHRNGLLQEVLAGQTEHEQEGEGRHLEGHGRLAGPVSPLCFL